MIVSFIPDLMMRSKLDAAARHYGISVTHVATAQDFRAALATQRPRLVLVDLDAKEVEDTVALIGDALKFTRARVVAFCSHVRTDLISAARKAGAHSVMANSTFASAVAGLVAEVVALPETDSREFTTKPQKNN